MIRYVSTEVPTTRLVMPSRNLKSTSSAKCLTHLMDKNINTTITSGRIIVDYIYSYPLDNRCYIINYVICRELLYLCLSWIFLDTGI